MAKVKDPLHSLQASGTISGITYQDWRGLGVVREKPVPTQPNSIRQIATRTVMTNASQFWANDLSEGLRRAWKNFADIFVWTDIFGKELRLTGINLFTKINFQLLDSGKALQETPPPDIIPSDPGIPEIDNQVSEVTEVVPGFPFAEETAQGTFLDIWLAGKATSVQILQDAGDEDAGVLIQTAGLPQGVNPVKSDYRHIAYLTPLAAFSTPTQTQATNIIITETGGGNWTSKRKISLIIRHYNKHGKFSSPVRSDVITIIA